MLLNLLILISQEILKRQLKFSANLTKLIFTKKTANIQIYLALFAPTKTAVILSSKLLITQINGSS